MSNVLEVTEQNFKAEVSEHTGWVLVDFWAPWCAPCHAMAPMIEETAKTFKDILKVAKINVEDHPSFSTIYKIRGIPTFIIFKNGEVVNTHVGASSKTAFQVFVQQTLGENPI